MFNLEIPINNLSFGNIGVNIAYELFRRGISPNIFLISNQCDLSAFDKLPEDFKQYLTSCVNKAVRSFDLDQPYLKQWHINGSCHKLSKKANYLLTFHELDNLTEYEVNTLNSFDKIFVTSNFSKQVFKNCGVKSEVIYTPMGFDSLHYKKLDRKFYDNGVTFGIFGKYEKIRKSHNQTIKAWISKYGGNPNFRLHLHITNPFFKPEDMNRVYADIFEGKDPPVNVILYGFQSTNSLMNQVYNAIDIVIDMSGGESISIPSMTCVALGKHAIVHHNSAMLDWANEQNSILVKPNGKTKCVDDIFFQEGSPFNQGNIFTYDTNDLLSACDEAIKRFINNPINKDGFELQERYSYKNGVNLILKEIGIT